MKILLIFTVYLISGQVDCDVTGYKGGSVLINCKYDFPNYKNHIKYFCKLNRNVCISKFLSNTQNPADPDGKIFFMKENHAGLFSVLIRNVSQQDSGKYRCGVDMQVSQNSELTLVVVNDACCGNILSQSVDEGESVAFTCKYPARYENHIKYLYKVTNHSAHAVIVALGFEAQNGSFSIVDHQKENLFKVRIRDVTVKDGGVYLCGVQCKNSEDRNSYYSLFNEMQLRVTVSPGSSAIIIAVSVCVVLLLIGGVALIIYKLRHERQDSASASSNRQNTVNSEENNHGPYYEEIPDTQTSSSTVYATAQTPKSPSKTQTAERTTVIYSMAQLRNSATELSTEYATVDDCT